MSRLASLALGLVHEHSRSDAARELSRRLTCERLCIFVRDAETSSWRGLRGMPWPQGDASAWRRPLNGDAEAIATMMVPHPETGADVSAVVLHTPDGTAFAFVGGHPRLSMVRALREPLALAAAAIQGQATAEHSSDQNMALAHAREAAQRASRIKEEFLATLSHELRTPLNAILGWLQLLRLHIDDPSERTHALDVLERNARAQAQIVSDLLDVSRVVTGNMRLTFEPLDATGIVREAAEALIPTARVKGVQLRIDIPDVVAPVSGDAHRLRQVVWNLVSNAVKFTPPRGAVLVKLRVAGSEARIEVTDTGIGIGADLLPHIFERFQQGDSSLTRPFGGLGLGLAIVRHLVELHGGSVDASSTGSGHGSSFVVRLPLGSGASLSQPTATTVSRAATPFRPSPGSSS